MCGYNSGSKKIKMAEGDGRGCGKLNGCLDCPISITKYLKLRIPLSVI